MSAGVLTPSDAIADLLAWGAYGRVVARALPVDPADEAIVDAFIRRTAQPEGSRPLRPSAGKVITDDHGTRHRVRSVCAGCSDYHERDEACTPRARTP